jgi:hypothetical protein
MAADRLLSSRFEMKYIIREEQAARVREFVRCYMELDEHGAGRSNYSYPVHSLYLDSDDLHLYWRTINGDKNRYKLRVRFYNDDPETPAFFEVKRRQNNCIIKHRAAVWRHLVPGVLAGQVPSPSDFAAYSQKQEMALLEFIERMESIDAKPKAHVAYLREAYLPADGNTARVTLDRAVRIEPQFGGRLSALMADPTFVCLYKANASGHYAWDGRQTKGLSELCERRGVGFLCGLSHAHDGERAAARLRFARVVQWAALVR